MEEINVIHPPVHGDIGVQVQMVYPEKRYRFGALWIHYFLS